jgi:hypothetical protein
MEDTLYIKQKRYQSIKSLSIDTAYGSSCEYRLKVTEDMAKLIETVKKELTQISYLKWDTDLR